MEFALPNHSLICICISEICSVRVVNLQRLLCGRKTFCFTDYTKTFTSTYFFLYLLSFLKEFIYI